MGPFMKDGGESSSVGGGCRGLVGNPGGDVGVGEDGGDLEDLLVIDDDVETPGLVVSGWASLLVLVGEDEGEVETEEETSSCSPRSRAIICCPAMA